PGRPAKAQPGTRVEPPIPTFKLRHEIGPPEVERSRKLQCIIGLTARIGPDPGPAPALMIGLKIQVQPSSERALAPPIHLPALKLEVNRLERRPGDDRRKLDPGCRFLLRLPRRLSCLLRRASD